MNIDSTQLLAELDKAGDEWTGLLADNECNCEISATLQTLKVLRNIVKRLERKKTNARLQS